MPKKGGAKRIAAATPAASAVAALAFLALIAPLVGPPLLVALGAILVILQLRKSN